MRYSSAKTSSTKTGSKSMTSSSNSIKMLESPRMIMWGWMDAQNAWEASTARSSMIIKKAVTKSRTWGLESAPSSSVILLDPAGKVLSFMMTASYRSEQTFTPSSTSFKGRNSISLLRRIGRLMGSMNHPSWNLLMTIRQCLGWSYLVVSCMELSSTSCHSMKEARSLGSVISKTYRSSFLSDSSLLAEKWSRQASRRPCTKHTTLSLKTISRSLRTTATSPTSQTPSSGSWWMASWTQMCTTHVRALVFLPRSRNRLTLAATAPGSS